MRERSPCAPHSPRRGGVIGLFLLLLLFTGSLASGQTSFRFEALHDRHIPPAQHEVALRLRVGSLAGAQLDPILAQGWWLFAIVLDGSVHGHRFSSLLQDGIIVPISPARGAFRLDVSALAREVDHYLAFILIGPGGAYLGVSELSVLRRDDFPNPRDLASAPLLAKLGGGTRNRGLYRRLTRAVMPLGEGLSQRLASGSSALVLAGDGWSERVQALPWAYSGHRDSGSGRRLADKLLLYYFKDFPDRSYEEAEVREVPSARVGSAPPLRVAPALTRFSRGGGRIRITARGPLGEVYQFSYALSDPPREILADGPIVQVRRRGGRLMPRAGGLSHGPTIAIFETVTADEAYLELGVVVGNSSSEGSGKFFFETLELAAAGPGAERITGFNWRPPVRGGIDPPVYPYGSSGKRAGEAFLQLVPTLGSGQHHMIKQGSTWVFDRLYVALDPAAAARIQRLARETPIDVVFTGASGGGSCTWSDHGFLGPAGVPDLTQLLSSGERRESARYGFEDEVRAQLTVLDPRARLFFGLQGGNGTGSAGIVFDADLLAALAFNTPFPEVQDALAAIEFRADAATERQSWALGYLPDGQVNTLDNMLAAVARAGLGNAGWNMTDGVMNPHSPYNPDADFQSQPAYQNHLAAASCPYEALADQFEPQNYQHYVRFELPLITAAEISGSWPRRHVVRSAAENIGTTFYAGARAPATHFAFIPPTTLTAFHILASSYRSQGVVGDGVPWGREAETLICRAQALSYLPQVPGRYREELEMIAEIIEYGASGRVIGKRTDIEPRHLSAEEIRAYLQAMSSYLGISRSRLQPTKVLVCWEGIVLNQCLRHLVDAMRGDPALAGTLGLLRVRLQSAAEDIYRGRRLGDQVAWLELAEVEDTQTGQKFRVPPALALRYANAFGGVLYYMEQNLAFEALAAGPGTSLRTYLLSLLALQGWSPASNQSAARESMLTSLWAVERMLSGF